MTTRTKRLLYSGIIVIIIALIVFLYYRRNIIEVDVFVVKKRPIERTITGVSSGTVEPLRRAKLQPLLPLKIKDVNFREGDRVRKGDVIVRLDDSELRIKVDIQKAVLASAEFRLKETEERYMLAKQNYERAKPLFAEGIMPDSRFDEIKTQFAVTGKEYEIAGNALNQARLGIKLAEEELEKTNIRAPFDGVISFLNATPGELPEYSFNSQGAAVSTANITGLETEPFCELIDDSVLKVEVPFDETDFMVIKRGQKVNITSDANPGKVLKGKVVYVSPVVSKAAGQNRTIDVEINFDQPNEDTLPVGASVDAEIILETKNDAVVVPTNAVIERDEVKFVYTVVIDRVEKRNVSTGISSWEFIEMLDGVKEGERVITSLDVVGLEEGKRVNISNE